MIQQNMVYFEQHKRGYVEYCVDYNHVLNRERFPRYIYSSKMIYGESGMYNTVYCDVHLTFDELLHEAFPVVVDAGNAWTQVLTGY